MSFPRYPAYKPSGVEWLGEVPEHWEVLPLKRKARLLTEKTDNRSKPVALENIESWTGRLIETESEFQGEGVSFEAGAILFGKLRPYLAKVYLASTAGEAVGDFHVIHSSPSLLSRLLQYQLLNREVIDLVNSSTYGAKMPRASWSFLGSIEMPIPPFHEQPLIATFLDHETAKIDALIAEQQRLIELLQEKRQAVISQAVTKGLNPDAPMKDSGVEWLGEVPEHWAISAVGYRYEVRLGKMLDEKRVTGQSLGPYLRNTDVQWESINVEELPEMDFEPSEHGRYSLQESDLLVCEGGEVGRSAIWQSQLPVCFYQKALHRLRPFNPKSDYCRFQLYIMRMACFAGVFEASSGKATINHLPAESFRRYRFGYPPLDEQISIAEHLLQVCGQLNELESEAQSLVGTLQERRSALISAAVTGQIDVRGLAPEAEAA
jgi:type I restriction enzyme S subunit